MTSMTHKFIQIDTTDYIGRVPLVSLLNKHIFIVYVYKIVWVGTILL